MTNPIAVWREAEAAILETPAATIDQLDAIHDAMAGWMITRRQALRAGEHYRAGDLSPEDLEDYKAAYQESTAHLLTQLRQAPRG